jgi:hypothetical protein
MMLVSVICKTPFFVGKKRLRDNVLLSREDIPGSIIRASLAKKILRNCPLYRPQDMDPHGRHNWVYVRDKETCSSCNQYQVCNSFSDWKIGFLQPKGAMPVTPEDRICKMNKQHGFHSAQDPHCRECAGRLENITGWKKDGQLLKINKMRTTRTAIDRFTRTARDGTLHTIEAIYSPDITWEFEWEGIPDYFQIGDLIEIGKYTSSGYGEFIVTDLRPKEQQQYSSDSSSVKLFLTSEAMIDAGWMDNEPVSNEEYLKKWKNALFQDLTCLKLKRVQAELDIYRGYDTTKGWGKAFKDPCLVITEGSIFEFESTNSAEKAQEEINQLLRKGIGIETNNGYGKLNLL